MAHTYCSKHRRDDYCTKYTKMPEEDIASDENQLQHPETCTNKKNAHPKFTMKWQYKFIAMIVFTAILFFLKITVGYFANSKALIADSFHMVTDFVALIIGFMALRIASSHTNRTNFDRKRYTFGWVRAEVLGGLMNTVFLMALSFSILVESLKAFIEPEEIKEPKPVLIVGCASFAINFIGLLLFQTSREMVCAICFCGKKHQKDELEKFVVDKSDVENSTGDETSTTVSVEETSKSALQLTWQTEYQTPHSLNIRGVYLHILEHFLVAIIVIVSAVLNMYVKKPWVKYIDPAFTLLVIALILHSTVPLFRETIILFMQSVPANLKIKDIEERLTARIPAVISIHEFHVWHLGGDQVIASAHLLFKNEKDFQKYAKSIKAFFRHEGIACITFQPEFLPKAMLSKHESGESLNHDVCYNTCYKDGSECMPMQCCANESPRKTNGNVENVTASELTT